MAERAKAMRLIDADALSKLVGEQIEVFLSRLDLKLPPTVDAVEVVRCKDCKHSEHWYGDKRLCHLWSETGIDVFEDGYCSYGERREDGKTD